METRKTGEHVVKLTIDDRTFNMPVMVPDDATFADGDFLEDALLERMLKAERERDEFADVAAVTIGIRWKRIGGKERGNLRLAQISKASPILHHLTDLDFVVWVAADHLRRQTEVAGMVFARLVEAILYHELCHLAYEPEDGVVSLKGHDFEGFIQEIQTHGLWKEELTRVKNTMQQLNMFEK